MADDATPAPEGVDDGAGRPDWLPPNFKDEQAFRASYDEAQRKIQEMGRENNELRGEFDELTASVQALTAAEQREQQQAGMSQQEADLVNALQRAREDGDTRAELAVMAHIANLQAQAATQPITAQLAPEAQDPALVMYAAEQQLRAQFPDYDQVRAEVGKQLDANPGLITAMSLQGVTAGISAAYRLHKADTLMAQETSQQQAAAQAEADRRAKLDAQSLTGSGTRQAPADEAATTWKSIVAAGNGSFADLLASRNQ